MSSHDIAALDKAAAPGGDNRREAVEHLDRSIYRITFALTELTSPDLRNAIAEGRDKHRLISDEDPVRPIARELRDAREFLEIAIKSLDRAMRLAGVEPSISTNGDSQ